MTKRKVVQEIFFQEGYSLPVVFKSGKLHSLEARRHSGWGMRIFKGGREGFSSTTSGDMDDLRRRASANLPFGPKADYSLPQKDERYRRVSNYHAPTTRTSEQELIDLGKKILSKFSRSRRKDVAVDVDLRTGYRKTRISNSLGLDKTHRRSYFRLLIMATRAREGDLLRLWGFNISPKMDEASALKTVDHMLKQLRLCERNIKPPTRRIPVLFSPSVLNELMHPIAAGLSGENWVQGVSPLRGRIGEQVTHESFSLHDNPLMPHEVTSSPFDDEGTPTARRPFIDNGKLISPTLTLATASQLKLPPTASAKRSYKGRPSGGSFLLEVSPGSRSFKEMLSEIDEGIYVEDVSGGGQSNTIAGEFGLGVRVGFIIKNGRLGPRVKDCMIVGNIYECLKGDFEMSSERENPWGIIYGPYIRFDSLTVSGKGR